VARVTGRRLRPDVVELIGHQHVSLWALETDMSRALDNPALQGRVTRWLEGLRLPREGPGRRLVARAAGRVMSLLVREYTEYMQDVVAEMSSRLAKLLADSEAVVAGRARRSAEERATDIRAIEEQLGLVRTLPQFSEEMLASAESPLAKRLRDEVSTVLAGRAERPPRARRGARPRAVPRTPEADAAVARILDGLITTSSSQWRGRHARRLLAATGGDVEEAFRLILNRSPETDPRPAVYALLRAAGLRNERRIRAFNTMFMDEMLEKILADKEHILGFLVDRKRGKWKGRTHADPKSMAVQAGHKVSFHSGEPERLFLENADFNQCSNWYGESKGAIFHKEGVVIGGAPIERRTAEQCERLGLLPKGTVANAPVHTGWTP
jgi:Bacterial toxin 5